MSNRDFRALANSVRKTERAVMPDASWLKQNRAKLVSHVASTMPRPELAGAGVAAFLGQFVPSQAMQFLRRPVLASISIFGVILGGSLAGVSASERSLPGDFFYPVKIATEQTRLALTGDSSEKLKLKTEFVQRRVDEIKTVAKQPVEHRQERIKTAAENLKRDLRTAKEQLTSVSSAATAKVTLEAAKLLDQKSSDVVAGLQEVKKESLSDESKVVVNEAENAAVNTGVKAVSVLIESKDTPEGAEVITEGEIKQSIENKVSALESQIQETSERLALSAASSTVSSSSTVQIVPTSTLPFASATASIVVANATLMEAKALLRENRLELVPVKLLEVMQVTAETNLAITAASSSASVLETNANATSTPSNDVAEVKNSSASTSATLSGGEQSTSVSTSSSDGSIPSSP